MMRPKPPADLGTIKPHDSVVAQRRISRAARPAIAEVNDEQRMRAVNVISVTEYKGQETISTLELLLNRARAGEVTGIAYAVCLRQGWDSGVGVTGAFRDSPASGLGAIGRLFDVLTKQFKEAPMS